MILSLEFLGKNRVLTFNQEYISEIGREPLSRRLSLTNKRFGYQMRPSITVFIAISQWTYACLNGSNGQNRKIVEIDHFDGELDINIENNRF